MTNKISSCTECALLNAFQPCEACPNYAYHSKRNLMKKVIELREQWYEDGCPEESEIEEDV